MGRNLEDRKKLTPVRIMNSADLNNVNILYIVYIFNGIIVIIIMTRKIFGWTLFPMNILGMNSNSCA